MLQTAAYMYMVLAVGCSFSARLYGCLCLQPVQEVAHTLAAEAVAAAVHLQKVFCAAAVVAAVCAAFTAVTADTLSVAALLPPFQLLDPVA